MRSIIAVIISIAMIVGAPLSAIAQASRYRVSTQVEDINLGPPPSFRSSGDQRRMMPIQTPTGIPQFPGGMPSGTGTPAGTTMGEAAMMSLGYQVHVLGEVMRPGTFRVVASDRVSEIIQRAGGFAENGSERNIELRRKGGGVVHVDLLAFKLFGKLDQNPYVTDNDTIYVPLRKSVIQVAGAVKRPDFYELKNEKTLADVVDLAGGFNAATFMKEPIRVIRFVDGEKHLEEVTIEKGAMEKFAIMTGDVVVVPNVVTKKTDFDYNVASIPGDQVFYPSYEDRVFVLGGIAFPGAYEFSPYYSVNQYITLAGGLNDRGKSKFRVITVEGKNKRAKPSDRVNPGDTIVIKQSWMSPASWMSFMLGVASFGLSASATIIAIRK